MNWQLAGLSIAQITVVGEPVENLFLWGHSATTLNGSDILVFGGFGGIGRHARRNDCFLFLPHQSSATLKAINVEALPSPRMGHTASLVGDLVYVIGGRADPLNILSDVWVINTAKNEWSWSRLECTGTVFPPR